MKSIKRGTPVTIKANGNKAVLMKSVYKNSKMAYVWDFDMRCDYAVKVDEIEETSPGCMEMCDLMCK